LLPPFLVFFVEKNDFFVEKNDFFVEKNVPGLPNYVNLVSLPAVPLGTHPAVLLNFDSIL
jgi:hypothetical protein